MACDERSRCSAGLDVPGACPKRAGAIAVKTSLTRVRWAKAHLLVPLRLVRGVGGLGCRATLAARDIFARMSENGPDVSRPRRMEGFLSVRCV